MNLNEEHYERNPDFIYRRIVDESVLVPMHNNVADMDCIYTLNSLGAFLWEQLANLTTRSELETAVLEEYDVESTELVADLDNFLSEMINIGAIKRIK